MKNKRRFSRRAFMLGGAGALSLAAFPFAAQAFFGRDKQEIGGSILGAASKVGHKLREASFPVPTENIEAGVVIVGGGMAGLSAAWKLQKSGVDDFLLLELEPEVGGNSHSGKNDVSAYPWGAHYVPLLTQEAKAAHELFEDFGVIIGHEKGLPVYNDYYLCSDPHERLYMYGRWHEGFVPQMGLTAAEEEQHRTFFAAMENFKTLRGRDGRRAFAIPVDLSSRDPNITHYDTLSMADYMKQQGWDAPSLIWYVDYCCRDDYGARYDQISAWAGIHYFAARNGLAANADSQTVVTWPEGNGWLVNKLKNQTQKHLHADVLVYSVQKDAKGIVVRYLDVTRNVTVQVAAKAVILATPRFVAQRLTGAAPLNAFSYSPWAIANITLDALPQGRGAPLSWDNMIYDSPLLGYVVATHQNLNRVQNDTVLTYYWPLSDKPPQQARQEALARSYEEWRDIFLKELLVIHPELEGHIKHLDIWLWGHGMIRPTPHFIWGSDRQDALLSRPPIFYAHSDMSGLSLFEEANYRGVKAAEELMTHLNHSYETSL